MRSIARRPLAGYLVALAAWLGASSPHAADAPAPERWDAVRALLHEAQQAKAWRTAYERALDRPRDGGIWLASLIVQRCAEAERVVSRYVEWVAISGVPGAVLQPQHRAAERLDQLCVGFAQEAADAEPRVQQLLASPEAQLDPLLALRERYRTAREHNDAAAADAALADAVALGSSLFFERLQAGAAPGRAFDERPYADDATRGRLYDAAPFLAVCDAWNDCPENGDYVLLRGCVERAACAQFRSDFVPLVLPPEAADARELNALTDGMYEALRSRQVQRFR